MHHTIVTKAEPGDNVGFNVRGLAADEIRRGDVAGYTDSEPTFVRHDETFVGQIQLMDIPKAVSVGYTPALSQNPCWLSSVKHRFLYYMKEIGFGPTSYEPSVHRNFKYWKR
jgi:elongation factor 1-alpha